MLLGSRRKPGFGVGKFTTIVWASSEVSVTIMVTIVVASVDSTLLWVANIVGTVRALKVLLGGQI
jgi:hypothetical protein